MRLPVRGGPVGRHVPGTRRWAALAAAMVGCSMTLSTGSASAASSTEFEYLYLVNQPSWYANPLGSSVNSGVEITTSLFTLGWFVTPVGTTSKAGVSGEGYTFAAENSAGGNSNLCLADTQINGPVSLQSCTADGTVWVAENNQNGVIFYDRYFLNMGAQSALQVNPLSNGARLGTLPAQELITGVYYRWQTALG
jgi:hypothetical protein